LGERGKQMFGGGEPRARSAECRVWEADTRNMADPRDSVEIGGAAGQPAREGSGGESEAAGGKFLRLWFRCSGQYARAQKSRDGTMYLGRCPTCGATARFPIGPQGTSERAFEVSCR